MTMVDQGATGALRDIGVLDNSKPAYTQTLGWKLAEASDWAGDEAHKAGKWISDLF